MCIIILDISIVHVRSIEMGIVMYIQLVKKDNTFLTSDDSEDSHLSFFFFFLLKEFDKIWWHLMKYALQILNFINRRK